MKFCIHRGASEIGGNCVEIESQGKRIVLDIGLPLDAGDEDVPLPPVRGFAQPDESLLGVIISHPHQDHCGLAHMRQIEMAELMIAGHNHASSYRWTVKGARSRQER
jgi:ribonuclease J